MPFVAFVHLAVAAFFGVHAIRSGQPVYWLFVLFAFPMLGSIVYFFAMYLPTMRHSRGGRKVVQAVATIVDPNRELREASLEYERTPTAYNRARLGGALLAKGRAAEAVEQYAQAASGPYAGDASFLKGLALSQLAAEQPADAAATLTRLFAAHPEQQRGELALLHAEALAGAGSGEAAAAFEAVIAADRSIEARYKYGAFLRQRGDDVGARRAFDNVLLDAKHGHAHSRDLNREWIALAREALKELDAAAAA